MCISKYSSTNHSYNENYSVSSVINYRNEIGLFCLFVQLRFSCTVHVYQQSWYLGTYQCLDAACYTCS